VAGTGVAAVLGVSLVGATAVAQMPPRPAPPGVAASADPVKILLLGDSIHLELALGFDQPPSSGFEIYSAARVGCGVMNAPYVDTCAGRPDEWRSNIERFDPDVVLVPASKWDLFPRVTAAGTIEFGSDQFAEQFHSDFDEAIAIVSAGGADVVLLTLPCLEPRDDALGGISADDVRAERITWINNQLAQVAERHPDAELIELGAYTCPRGSYEPELSGVDLHEDGVHFTSPAIDLVWGWLLPQIRDIARQP
jgi:hypothetical protein